MTCGKEQYAMDYDACCCSGQTLLYLSPPGVAPADIVNTLPAARATGVSFLRPVRG